MTESIKPLPCPFCAGEDIEATCTEDSELIAYCNSCHAACGAIDHTDEDGEEDDNGMTLADRNAVFQEWNKRA